MIKIDKKFKDIPEKLKNLESYFIQNNESKKFIDKNNKYKVIKKELIKLYNNKCVYCEKEILDSFYHIEHYRPKSKYYWLSYSWDNLFLSCEVCNIKKGDTFEIEGSKATYDDEPFSEIHNLGDKYDKKEKPKNINPEKEDVINKIIFDSKGAITSSDERVSYTIKVCDLDRENLRSYRISILNDFIRTLNNCLWIYSKKKDIDIFIPTIDSFKEKCKKENSFYAFRQSILDNPDVFFENKILLKLISYLLKGVSSIPNKNQTCELK